jgi:hypothetical protein
MQKFVVHENSWLTVKSIAKQENINRETVRKLVTEDLGMRKVYAENDIAPAHTTLSVRVFSASKQITVLEHPPYSPDLDPSDIFLFPEIQEILKGRLCDEIDDIRNNMMAALKAIPQNQVPKLF